MKLIVPLFTVVGKIQKHLCSLMFLPCFIDLFLCMSHVSVPGTFYSAENYVFVVTYWADSEDDDDNEVLKYLLYFWQGRDANSHGWVSFKLT